MNEKLLIVAMAIASVLYVSPAQAHDPGYSRHSYGGLTGSITVRSGGYYGSGYSGTINYGYPVAPPYPGAYFYPSCNHWHPKHYRAPANHVYDRSYAYGYDDGYTDRHHGYKKPRHHSKHGYSHGRGYRH